MIDKSAPNWEDSFNKANKRVEHALREQNSHVIIKYFNGTSICLAQSTNSWRFYLE